jgi:hypothetical protein
MDGKALEWFRESRASNVFITWPELVRSMQISFGRRSYDDDTEIVPLATDFIELEELHPVPEKVEYMENVKEERRRREMKKQLIPLKSYIHLLRRSKA